MTSDALWDCVVMDNGLFVDMTPSNRPMHKANRMGARLKTHIIQNS